MKIRSFTLTLSLIATLLLVATPLFADDKYEDTDEDYCISGTGKITKDQSIVRAKASFRATMSADTGWYWVHSRVLPYSIQMSRLMLLWAMFTRPPMSGEVDSLNRMDVPTVSSIVKQGQR